MSLKDIWKELSGDELLLDITMRQVVKFTKMLMCRYGDRQLYYPATKDVDILHFRGALPDDFIMALEVKDSATGNILVPESSSHTGTGLSYKVQDTLIVTSMFNGKITVDYVAVTLDDEGYPKVPDNTLYTDVLKKYIKMNICAIKLKQRRAVLADWEKSQADYAASIKALPVEFVVSFDNNANNK